MKIKLGMIFTVFAYLIIFQACTMDYASFMILLEYDIPPGVSMPFGYYSPIEVDSATFEFRSGTYNFFGNICTGNENADFETGEKAAQFPRLLYITLRKITTVKNAGDIDPEFSAKKITVRIKVNSKTGTIANQKVFIPKGMSIDPKKGEKIRLEIKVKGASLNKGNKVTLGYLKIEE